MSEAAFKAFSGGRSLAAETRALNAMSVPELVAAAVAGFGTRRAAAEALGVHPSTLRRWAAGSTSPRANRSKLVNTARAVTRRARLGPRREKKIRGTPSWTLTGRVFVKSGKDPAGDDRHRTVRPGKDLPEGNLSPALDAYLAGDDQAAGKAVEDQLSRYVSGMAMAPGEVEALHL
jgi:DNA-binding transcriptional regulator YdaS (Cro superfamily)